VSARHPQTCKPIKDPAASNGVSNLQRCRAAGYLTLAAVLLAGIKLALRNKAAQKWSEIMKNLSIPTGYEPALNLHDTQIAIKTVKDFFQNLLAERLNLLRVSAPLFVTPESGLNDNLNGVERPVSFGIKDQGEAQAEIVHSLAKWKRYALQKYGFSVGEGLYTDMSAIRRDEETDNIHSIYVDQWDWEKIITKEMRTLDTLKDTVRNVYKVLRKTEKYMAIRYDYIEEILPHDIFFITTGELEKMFPDSTPKEREYYISKEKGAVCVMQIGDLLASGEKHDGRAPDYDDWALNADIIVYYPVLDIALELSSMGIRVDKEALLSQLEKAGCPERAELPFQKAVISEELPYTIGGGIGQSRICMFFLRKAHIGEVQCSLWPENVMEEARKARLPLL
jgi:aspartate--ammonia ligase